MASRCQRLKVYVKAATGNPCKLGDCPFSQRVLITCELKNIAYDVKFVDLDRKPEWFLRINPEGRVPVIKINGDYIPDSDIIVDVLEKSYPYPPLSTCRNITCRGQNIFPAGMAFFKSKNPRCDGTESQFVCELDHMNHHLCNEGPYIAGQYVTSADIALAPQLYVLQTALAYYKNWTNFEQFYPALNLFMKVYSHKYHLKTHARPSSQPNKKPPPH
ncbi:glutathione S-transferase DHAR2 isoform X2 [Physcomitrium patens]|uniref:DHAR class glutathione S-transferase n=1 Tax=Physcomitrium patens TaxID=3218 RepID=K9Y2Z4_PHYPA|nr:DHAR class glutathione S-transferase [Physcomitrium patens]